MIKLGACEGREFYLADRALFIVAEHAEVVERDVDSLPRGEFNLPWAEGGAVAGALGDHVTDVSLGPVQFHRLVRLTALSQTRRDYNKSVQELQYNFECTIYMNKSIGSIEIHKSTTIKSIQELQYNSLFTCYSESQLFTKWVMFTIQKSVQDL